MTSSKMLTCLNTDDRKHYVDYIKAIGMILVILGHINFANESIKAWIYAFHMPLFFFATGLITRPEKIDCKFILKKFCGLMIPYFLWGLIYSELSFGNLARLFYGSYYTISKAGSLSSLWFLPTMFIAVLIVQVILGATNNKIAIGMIAIVSFIAAIFIPQLSFGYPWCMDVALLAVTFILIGYLLKDYIDKISKQGGYLKCIVLIAGGFMITLISNLNPIVEDSYVLMAGRRLGNPGLFTICAVGGCVMILGIALLLENTKHINNPLEFIGQNTIVIFAVQKPIISVFAKCFNYVTLPDLIELLVTCFGTIIGSCVICFLVNQFVPCMNGKIVCAKETKQE